MHLQKSKQASEDIPVFEKLQVKQAKDIIKPFILRRLKRDVMRHLPKKYDEMVVVPMVQSQKEQYEALVNQFKRIGDEVSPFFWPPNMSVLKCAVFLIFYLND